MPCYHDQCLLASLCVELSAIYLHAFEILRTARCKAIPGLLEGDPLKIAGSSNCAGDSSFPIYKLHTSSHHPLGATAMLLAAFPIPLLTSTPILILTYYSMIHRYYYLWIPNSFHQRYTSLFLRRLCVIRTVTVAPKQPFWWQCTQHIWHWLVCIVFNYVFLWNLYSDSSVGDRTSHAPGVISYCDLS